MDSLLKKIKIEDSEQQVLDVDAIVKSYSKTLEELECLKKESCTSVSEGKFESKIWIVYVENREVYSSINFSDVEDMVQLGTINKEDYLLFKCWCSDKIVCSEDPTSTSSQIRVVLDIFKKTQGFKPNLVKNDKGNEVTTYIDSIEAISRKIILVRSLKSYINFLQELDAGKEVYTNILNEINNMDSIDNTRGVRKLPKNSHIFKFNYLINKFFEEEDNLLLKKIYYPLLIWWKVTTVIPMRPSELATKTYRDCLINEDEKEDGDKKYFLKLNRIKIKKDKARIPVLNKIELNQDTYNLIKDYIDFTDFTTSKTLFSHNALIAFKEEYLNSNSGNDDSAPVFQKETKKFNPQVFNIEALNALLDSFYNQILAKKYGYICENEDKLDLGDSRHIAFSSLYLQGISPIEVAMLGGHTTLNMQNSYSGHVQYYMDDETLNFISNRTVLSQESKLLNNLKNIILTKKWGYELDVRLSNFDKTDDGIGYCLLDFNSTNETLCEDVPHCSFCSKWWCEPTNENYIAIRDYLLKNKVHILDQEIKAEEEIFKTIINETKLVDVNGLIEIDKNDDDKRKSQAIKLRAKADKLVQLKLALIESNFTKELVIE